MYKAYNFFSFVRTNVISIKLTFSSLPKYDSMAKRVLNCLTWILFIRFSIFLRTNVLANIVRNFFQHYIYWDHQLLCKHKMQPVSMVSNMLQKNAKVHRPVDRFVVKCVTIWSIQSTPVFRGIQITMPKQAENNPFSFR